jgi:hypothetical protein
MKSKKVERDQEIIHLLYKRAFAESDPPADFDELLEKAELNDRGQKIIPFMDHECDHEKLEEIFETTMEEYKVPKDRIKAFSFHFWMGCSPKSRYKK